MKKILSLLLLAIACAGVFHACQKEFSNEVYTGPSGQIMPNLSVKVNASVSGFITDETGAPVDGANITAGNKQAITNKFGFFSIEDALLPAVAGFVKVEKNGYFSGFRTFVAKEAKETFVRLQLIPKKEAGTIDATAGGTATTSDGAKVSLPANGVVVAGSGAAYTGRVHVAAHWLNPTAADLQLTMPGDLRGIDSAGFMNQLLTYGMLAVELTGDAGQKLQVATGSLATISTPIPSGQAATAPATIPLWSFDEANGLWKQESIATKTGSEYVGKVSHFSFWNCDVPSKLVSFTAQVVNEKLQPLKNVAVSISIKGQPYSARWGYTDSAGHVYGYVPANANLVLEILTECRTPVFTKEFSTTTTAVDLGSITATLTQYAVTISGTAVDCNNQPIRDGYVFTTGSNFVNRIFIDNGAFKHAGLLCTNTGTLITAVAIDNENAEQGIPQEFTIQPGDNSLGELHACGISTATQITFSVDGLVTTLSDTTSYGTQGLVGYFTDSAITGALTKVIDRTGRGNATSKINFDFDGETVTGDAHILKSLFLPGTLPYNGQSHPTSTPIVVSVSEYGPAGGFITGSFSGTVLDSAKINTHTIKCSFRVKRVQ